MLIFKPKKGKILQVSRFLHLFEAGTITLIGAQVLAYQGGVWACFLTIVGGFGWELSNKYVVPGDHRFGDAWDFLFFVFGSVIGETINLLL